LVLAGLLLVECSVELCVVASYSTAQVVLLCCTFDDGGVQQRRHEAIEPDKEQSVRWREPWLGRKPTPQQVQLMAQEDNLGLQPRLRDLKGEANACSNKPRNEAILPRCVLAGRESLRLQPRAKSTPRAGKTAIASMSAGSSAIACPGASCRAACFAWV
jgi:hypothetical protein